MKTIETKRVILREFVQDDLNDFFEYAKHPDVGPMAGWKPHETIADTQTILDNFIKKQEVWAVYHILDKRVIGSIGVHKRSIHPIFELGYVLSKDYWGQGIIVEACLRLIKHVFDEFKIDTLMVEHFKNNQQSKRVIEKLGFKYQKEVKDCFTMYNGVKHDCLRYVIERKDD